MEILAVAAVAENGVIGEGSTLPWKLPEEVRRYRERVAGGTVAVGRRTFEMFGDGVPGARAIVLSRSSPTYDNPDVTVADGPEAAIEAARAAGADTLYVLGGAMIYELFLPDYDRMLLSRIDGEYEGDAVFPEFDRSAWDLVEETRYDGYTLEEWVPAD